MSLLEIMIVLALIATTVAMVIGAFAMGAGRDYQFSTWMMWARVGLQGFTILLLLLALIL